MPTVLFDIAFGVGTLLSLDESTKKRTVGHFARVLVDIIMAKEMHDQILVERGAYPRSS